MDCRKCPYFLKERENKYRKGMIILGFCKLRQKYISDTTINKQFCKDRAVIEL